jgi:hypothetical protein
MKVDDFASTIGYSGITAVVDKQIQKSVSAVDALLEKGQYKAAFSKALYENDDAAQGRVLTAYNKASSSDYKSVDELKRLFGVFRVPEKITKVKRI